MGIIARYYEVKDEQIDKYVDTADDDKQHFADDWLVDNPAVNKTDIGEMWDALHFVLTSTGMSATSRINGNSVNSVVKPLELLSDFIVGNDIRKIASDEETFTAYILSENVKQIVQVLQSVKFAAKIQRFGNETCANECLHPGVPFWDGWENDSALRQQLTDHFNNLKDLYHNAASNGNGIFIVFDYE